ncbi:MAG: YeiH family protein [Geminicoccaceae bacterium]
MGPIARRTPQLSQRKAVPAQREAVPASTLGALAQGLALCVAIAGAASVAGGYLPLIGAPVIAIVIGVVIANALDGAAIAKRLRVGTISGYALRGGIVLLGLTLDLAEVARTGGGSLLLLAITVTSGLGFALLAGRRLGIGWRTRCLIGIGTTVCGASAIAALAPVLRAKTAEIAYAISVIFLFNMLAVVLFPGAGRALGLSDGGFGLWAGTAINDTSAVVAAGYAFSQAAGTCATIVKLTRTTLIVPLVLGFGLAMPWLDAGKSAPAGGASAGGPTLLRRLRASVPVFILLFLLAALCNSLGLVGDAAPKVQSVARFVMVVALAAVGLQGHWRGFARAGLRPLALGLGTWATVALTSLAVQIWTARL